MTRFAGKVALVTGGRSGIGLAIADRLAAEGASVFTAQRGTDTRHRGIRANLGDPAAPQVIVDQIRDEAGALDILVNCAGVMHEATLDAMASGLWEQTLAINLTAPALLIRAALPLLRQGPGVVVNVGSIEGPGANPQHPAYVASKSGLHGLTRAVAVDHGPDGIRCNAVAPGWIDTDLNTNFIAAQPDPARFRDQIGEIHPVRRTGTPSDVAAAVAFLASDDARFITGQVLVVDGGRTVQLSLPR